MAVAKHGVTTDSPDRIMVDAGAVYLGFLDATNPGTLLGATRGGNSFELARIIRQMQADGAKGPVKGLRRVEEVVATIKANMLELTAGNLRRAIADAIYSSGTTQITTEVTGDGDGSVINHHLGTTIEDCEDAWDESDPVTGVTSAVDAGEAQVGTNCIKLTMTAGAVAGILATEVISLAGNTLDDYNKLAIRVKSSITVAANQLQILLDDTALCASPCATINLPYMLADTWYDLVVPADFSGCTGLTIISVGVNQVSDLGAFILYVDELKASAMGIEEGSETITVGGAAQTRMTEYTMDYDKGVIQFVAAPGDSVAIVATYKYVSGDAVIGEDTTEANKYRIKDTAYVDSVAIVGFLTGKTDPVIIKITDALCDAGLNLAMAPKDEAVPELTFTAHYARTDLDTEPWSIEYPTS